jgi:hypothetical protein
MNRQVLQVLAAIRLQVCLGERHANESTKLEAELGRVTLRGRLCRLPLGCLAPFHRPAKAALCKHLAPPFVNGIMNRRSAAVAR